MMGSTDNHLTDPIPTEFRSGLRRLAPLKTVCRRLNPPLLRRCNQVASRDISLDA